MDPSDAGRPSQEVTRLGGVAQHLPQFVQLLLNDFLVRFEGPEALDQNSIYDERWRRGDAQGRSVGGIPLYLGLVRFRIEAPVEGFLIEAQVSRDLFQPSSVKSARVRTGILGE